MKRLGEMLMERGSLNAHQLQQALNHQKYFGGRLGTCLLELNLVSETRLAKTLAEQLQVATVPPEDLRSIDASVLEIVPTKVACRGRVVPFERTATGVSVALVDVRDLTVQDELAFVTSKRVKVFLAPEVRILEALEKHYNCDVEMRYQRIWDRLNRAKYLWQGDSKVQAGVGPAPAAAPGSALPTQPRATTASGTWSLTPPPELEEVAPIATQLPPPLAERERPPAEGAPPTPASEPTSASGGGGAARIQPERSPQRPTEVEVPEEFRDALGTLSPASATGADSVEALQESLDSARERDEIAEALLGFLRNRFARALLFMVRAGEVAGWMGDGPGVDQARLLAFELGFESPSFFLNLREGSAFSRGPLPKMEGHLRLAEIWGGELPSEVLMLPIRLRDRLVAVAYGDKGGEALGGIDIVELQEASRHTSRAFEELLRRKKATRG